MSNQTEAFVYAWTNKDTDKKYVGVHKGDTATGYVATTESEEFWTDYYKGLLERKILFTGTYLEMVGKEQAILQADDARNNPTYYNQSNGGGRQVKSVDTSLILTIKDSLEKGILPKKTLKVSEVKEYPRFQVRQDNTDPEKVTEIAERIKDSKSRSNMAPLVIVSDYNGGNLLVDGNHTRAAAVKAKLQEIDVVFIPYTSLGENELALSELGLALNSSEVIKTPNTKADIKAYFITCLSEGRSIESPEAKRNYSKLYNESLRTIGKLVSSAKKEFESSKPDENGMIKKVWEKDELEAREQIISATFPTRAVSYSSSHAAKDQGLGILLRKMAERETKEAYLIVYHGRGNLVPLSEVRKEVEKVANFLELDILVEMLPDKEESNK